MDISSSLIVMEPCEGEVYLSCKILCDTWPRHGLRYSSGVFRPDVSHRNRNTGTLGNQLWTVRNTCQKGNQSHKQIIMSQNSPSAIGVVYKLRGWNDIHLSSTHPCALAAKISFCRGVFSTYPIPRIYRGCLFCRHSECKPGEKFTPRIPCSG